jgi:hypothetical protein
MTTLKITDNGMFYAQGKDFITTNKSPLFFDHVVAIRDMEKGTVDGVARDTLFV